MFRANDGEVAPIQRGNRVDTKSLGEGDHGCVDGPKRKVVVSAYELGDPDPITSDHRLRKEISGSEISKETHLRLPAQARFDEISDFGNDQLRHQQRSGMGFQEMQALLVVAVIFVDVGVRRPGIDDQRDRRTSERMISSIRRAVSREPLRPALAAISFRRAPPPR